MSCNQTRTLSYTLLDGEFTFLVTAVGHVERDPLTLMLLIMAFAVQLCMFDLLKYLNGKFVAKGNMNCFYVVILACISAMLCLVYAGPLIPLPITLPTFEVKQLWARNQRCCFFKGKVSQCNVFIDNVAYCKVDGGAPAVWQECVYVKGTRANTLSLVRCKPS